MFNLRILGTPELTGPDGTTAQSVLKQPKRLALLAFLAAGSGARMRSELLGTFWPESDEERGRHALSQALYYLRRSLGKGVVEVEGELVRLLPAALDIDLWHFREHLAAGRLDAAVALYRGDLLQGFPSIAEVEFEHWLDGAREGLRQQVLSALERLSLQAEARGHMEAAVEWAEQAHLMAPRLESPVRRLLTALIAASEPVRAREVYERFAAQLRSELDMEPSPATAALLSTRPPAAAPADPQVGALSVGGGGPTVGDQPVIPPEQAAPEVEDRDRLGEGPGFRAPGLVSPPAPAAAASPNPAPETPTTLVRFRRRWGSRRMVATLVLGLGVLGLGGGAYMLASPDRPEAEAASSANRVGVFPFFYRGHDDLGYLAEGIPELMGITMRGLDRVSALDPRALRLPAGASEWTVEEAAVRARDLGAEHFVVGSVLEAGGQIQVAARLHRSDGALVASVSQRAAGEEELFGLVDDLVRQLVASGAFPGASDLERTAALTTGSLPALLHFLRGEGLFRRARYQEAAAAFDDAVDEDPEFALALYRGAVASIWSSEADFAGARRRIGRALQHTDRVSVLEADLFQALDQFLRGRLPPAEDLYESVLVRQPENLEAWFQLAETQFHYGALHGRSAQDSRQAWDHVLTLNPRHHAALIHASALAARRGDPGLDTLAIGMWGPGDSVVATPQVEALRVFSSGKADQEEAFLSELRRYPSAQVVSTAAYASRYLHSPAVGLRIARLLTEPERPAADRGQGHLLLAHFEVAAGRPRDARRALDEARDLTPAEATLHGLFLSTMPDIPMELQAGAGPFDLTPPIDVAEFGDAPITFDGTVESALLAYLRTLAYQRAGGEDGAPLTTARWLNTETTRMADASFTHGLASGLVGQRLLEHGEIRAARDTLAGGVAGVERWYEHLRVSHLRSLVRERFLLAEAEIALGNDAVAEAMLRSIGENAVSELPYLVPALVRIGEIRERAGDAAGAREAYGSALHVWAEADPAMDPMLDELRSRVQRLE